VGREGMGVSVPEQDVIALADALEKVLYDEEFAASARNAVHEVREQFTWEEALRPLVEFCRNPQIAADRAARMGDVDASKKSRALMSNLTPGERLHEAATGNTGVARELALARHYLTEGGFSMLVNKAGSRVRGTLGSKSTPSE